MREYVRAFGRFIASYLFWIVILATTNVAVWAGMEWSWRRRPPTDLWAVRMYLASGLLLFDSLCIAVDQNGTPRHEVLGVVRPGEVVRVRGNAEQLIRSPAHVLTLLTKHTQEGRQLLREVLAGPLSSRRTVKPIDLKGKRPSGACWRGWQALQHLWRP